MSTGYLGPEGTFTHQALLTMPGPADELVPFATVPQTLQAVRDARVRQALVPIENSVEGGVSSTLDALGMDDGLVIVNEVLLPVRFGLYARPGTQLSAVRRVLTHPHAYAQCREWLARNLPGATTTEGGSTAAAAAEVADADSAYDAAICASIAGERFGLSELAGDIADTAEAVTRFVMIAPGGSVGSPTGSDKTTLVAYLYQDHPGALLEILEQFASRGVNLTRLESRPTKRSLGDYCFSIDAEGHVRDPRLAEALMGLHRICQRLVFLGSYPRADGQQPILPRGAAAQDYVAAQGWLESLG